MEENVNKRVKLVYMEDKYTDLKPGDLGTIKGVDALGDYLVKWDNGSSLKLIPGVDKFEFIGESRVYNFKKFLESNYQAEWDSSIKSEKLDEYLPTLKKNQNIIENLSESEREELYFKIEQSLSPYDSIVCEKICDIIFNDDLGDNDIKDELIKLGDKIMSKYGTEPMQVLNALEDVNFTIKRYLK